jgi:hypothetical protein
MHTSRYARHISGLAIGNRGCAIDFGIRRAILLQVLTPYIEHILFYFYTYQNKLTNSVAFYKKYYSRQIIPIKKQEYWRDYAIRKLLWPPNTETPVKLEETLYLEQK